MNPYELVSQAIGCEIGTLSSDAGLNTHPEWDSFRHVKLITLLEEEYSIEIDDNNILVYQKMDKIIELYNNLVSKHKGEAHMVSSIEKFASYDGLILEGTLVKVPKSKLLAILVHGITSDRDELGFYSDMAIALANAGVSSFRFDYRCHGVDKTPMEQLSLGGITNDIEAAIKHVKTLIPYDKLFLVGTSFGGGVSAYWAYCNPGRVTKLFLNAPVISYEEDILKTGGYWVDPLQTYGFINYAGNHVGRALVNEMPYINGIKALAAPPCPVTIFHGDADDDVPLESSQKYMCKRDDCKLIIVEGVGHGFGVTGDENLNFPETKEIHKRIYHYMLEAMLDG